MATKIVMILRVLIQFCLQWWFQILDALGMRSLWFGAVAIVMLFSIVLTPMRGGQLLGGGAIGSFASNQINKHRKNKKKTDGDD